MPSAVEPLHRPRPLLLAAGVVVILAVAGSLLDRYYSDSDFLPPDDFLQYWAAGRLQATGGNPYDADQLLPLQREAGRPDDKPAVVMWNPPWSLTLTMPFGLLPPRTAQLLWLGLQVVVLIVCVDRLWLVYGGPAKFRMGVWAAALAFFPTMYILFAGQGSGWLLLGLMGLLLAATRGPQWLAALIPFLALKPHLFIPLWLVLTLETGRSRRGRAIFLVGLASGLVAVAIPTMVNPNVWSQYFAAFDRPADGTHLPLSSWKSPLVGWWTRIAIDPEAFWIQGVPTLLAAVCVPIYWWTRRQTWDWPAELPVLVAIGLIAAPYGGWPYDQVVLLVPVAAAAAHLARHAALRQAVLAAAAILLVNAVALVIRAGENFVWAPPLILAWYTAVMLAARPGAPREVETPATVAPVEEDQFATVPR